MVAYAGHMSTMVDMPETTLSVKEAAERLKVSQRRIVDLINEDRFPGAFKKGRVWRIPVEAVEHFQYKPTGRPRKKRGRPHKSSTKRGS